MFSCFPGLRAPTLFLAQGEQVRRRSGRKSVQAEQAWLPPPAPPGWESCPWAGGGPLG